MIRINLSKPDEYYSQRNNTIRPLETCAPTAMVDALVASGIVLPPHDGQPEDALTHFLEHDPRVVDFYRNHAEAWIRDFAAKGRPANEIHPVLAYGTNCWLGFDHNIVRFTWSATLGMIARAILSGHAVVVSGEWPCLMRSGELKEIGHVVAVVGFETCQESVKTDGFLDPALLISFILDDPYGDYRTAYREKKGDDIVCSIPDFMRYTKTRHQATNKLAHFINC